MEELLVSSLATADALVKLRKGFTGHMLPRYTACLVTLATLTISSYASAEQKLVDLLFARGVVNSETVRPFEPGAYCEKEPEPSGPLPVIDSTTKKGVLLEPNRVFSDRDSATHLVQGRCQGSGGGFEDRCVPNLAGLEFEENSSESPHRKVEGGSFNRR